MVESVPESAVQGAFFGGGCVNSGSERRRSRSLAGGSLRFDVLPMRSRATPRSIRPISELRRPYLLFLGDAADRLAAKTAIGILAWRPDWCLGQLALPGCRAVLDLPTLTSAEAAAQGARTLVIGVANAAG